MWMDLLMVDVNVKAMSHQGSTVSLHSRFLCFRRFVYRKLKLDGLIMWQFTDSVETTSENFGDDEHISRGGEMQRRFRDPGSSTILLDYRLYTMVKTKGFSLDLCGYSDLTFEMNAPSQRTRVGRAVKPTQKLDHG
ncbi:hypothetical protein YC2023_065778 [Brassica napus]